MAGLAYSKPLPTASLTTRMSECYWGGDLIVSHVESKRWSPSGHGRYIIARSHSREVFTDCPQGDDNSPASFERILSNLSTKISKTSSRLDNLRQRSRRLKVLWTLYAGFAYLLCTIILTLVVGWRQWGPIEYTVVAGGPLMYSNCEFLMNSCA